MESVSRLPSLTRHVVAGCGLVVLAGLVGAGCDSARRPVPKSPQAREVVRMEGRALVERACAAHGGVERWKAINDVVFNFDDRWSGAAGRVVRPWPVGEAKGQFQMLLHAGYGRVQIATKTGTITYGVGAEGPWAMRGMRPSQGSEDLTTARTTIPAYLFTFQFPFTFLVDDAVIHYMGLKPAPPGGPVYEVLITYPWYTGDRARDWYVARFDTASLRLRSVTYTRSMWGPSAFEYTDDVGGYVQVDSLWIPTHHDVRMSWPFRPHLHEWTVSDLRANQGLEEVLFRGPAPLGAGGR